MTPNLRTLGAALLLLAGAAQAEPRHAITLYDEPPKYPANFQHFDYVNPDAPKGGTLRQQSVGGFDSFNPFIPKGNAVGVGLIYDSLTYHSPDEPFTEYGLLAERIDKAPDNSYVRFILNPKARFHDGTPVTAEDVIFTFNILLEKGDPMYRHYYADVAQVVAEDKLRVRFDFKHQDNRELPLILGQIQVLPKHWWATRDFSKGDLEPPLGSGPYRIGKVAPGSAVTFERVKDWWAKDLPVSRGLYNFDRIQVDFYRDSQVALEAFKAGQFDVNLEYSAKDWNTGYDSPALRAGKFVQLAIPNHNPAGMQGYVFNLRRPIFQDRRVREAIAQLFDFEWANKQLFYGAYKRTHSYFENSEMAASGLPSEAELKLLEPLRDKLPPEVFSQEFKPPVSDGSGIIREQSRRAYQLLTEAGYRIDNDKMIGPDGKQLAFEFLNFQPNLERVVLPFKRNLAELGIDLQIRRVDVSQYINRLRSRDFDMTSAIWPQSSSPGNEQREFWHSSSADNPGSRNLMGLRDPAIDQLVEGLIRSGSREELITHARALDRALLWGHYVVPNYYVDTWRVAYWKRFGRPPVTPLYDYGLMTWWEETPLNPPKNAPAPEAKQEAQ
ncbi:extracellular solute-binding protein [Aquipseudomonas alcaligenes]|uniref:Peptide ABC transporter substrate-binding protein n=1 Tax=Aquipseudomonas alcaligenes (strain ATCC 14909 / DSM 50342 / CCUG 1425 / JCM 20561 / NBRC 14159 / NCIMB 9945 / NCTC 10367 / 1577) TaxID=1215092 RepID=U2Z155_AQUA1|nr:extracellular solute-binding protein [Pseudomonas alcaligenes]GAD61491.1 putative peptide ABC transporter substrate-binding protein [Pseudomonas alcaligenes NBRC 14159]SUD14933.1 family 5 extracellular solute-binding protein [Pseudomonas alcaligenes]